MKKIIIILLFLTPITMLSDSFSLYIENDFPFNTDRYYTHGWGIRYSSNKLDSSDFLQKISLIKNNFKSYISLNQQLYTPNDRLSTDKLTDDHPYSGLLYFKLSTFASSSYDWFFKTEYSIGLIGESAFGKESQEAIHSITASSLNPKGWDNQLKNDLILNADFSFLRVLLDFPIIEIHGLGLAGVGTLNNYVGLGISLQKYFEISHNINFAFNFVDHYNASIYDTKLRGTFLFNSDEALSADKIETFYNTYRLNLIFRIYNFDLIVAYNNVSKQIKSGYVHKYVTLELAYIK